MAKIVHDGITYDSQLEIDYHEYLKTQEDVLKIFYHLKKPIHVGAKNTYTPDFVVVYNDRIEIVETKGYNQYSYMRDNLIHNYMLSLREEDLKAWLSSNFNGKPVYKEVIYRKIKYLKAFGFVDFDFKNPNTLANKRKSKIAELNIELKQLKEFKKNTTRYFSLKDKPKLTPNQQEFINNYLKKWKK
jgi:hypothetical protein